MVSKVTHKESCYAEHQNLEVINPVLPNLNQLIQGCLIATNLPFMS